MDRTKLTEAPWATIWAFLVTHPRVYVGRPEIRWSGRGVWADWHRHVAADPDWQAVLLDSTVVRAHAYAAGAKKATRMPKPWGARAAASARRSMP